MQNHGTGVSRRLINAQQDFAPHHHACYLCLAGLSSNQFTRVLATAQYRNSIREFEHFTQLVRDEDDGLALRYKAAQDSEELCCLLRRQNARRFIHDEDVSAAIQYFEDFNSLL